MESGTDYLRLQTDLVRILRGKRSQAQLSRLLGYGYNQVHFWESGKTKLGWVDFARLCQKTRAPLSAALREVLSYYDSPLKVPGLVKHVMGENRVLEYARTTGISRFKLSRWIYGRSEPTLAEVLELIELSTSEFYSFVSVVCAGKIPETIRDRMESDVRCLELYEKYPWLSLIFCALETRGYLDLRAHSDTFLAKRTGLGLPLVKAAIEDLRAAHLIVFENHRYVPKLQKLNIRGSAEWRRKIVRFWKEAAQENFDATFGKPQTRHSFKVFNLSEEGFEKVLQAYTRFFNEVGLLINSEKTASDRFFLMSVDFLPCDPMRKMPNS